MPERSSGPWAAAAAVAAVLVGFGGGSGGDGASGSNADDGDDGGMTIAAAMRWQWRRWHRDGDDGGRMAAVATLFVATDRDAAIARSVGSSFFLFVALLSRSRRTTDRPTDPTCNGPSVAEARDVRRCGAIVRPAAAVGGQLL